jgi:hypothetical protein
MTNEEAIRILKNVAVLATSTSYQAIEEAVEVATKALTSATDINVATKDGDMVYRQDAIDALDCINCTEEVLRSLPSAQPEIIRCKDCKHYKAYYYTGCLACHLVEGRTVRRDLDDFCSRAERGEE